MLCGHFYKVRPFLFDHSLLQEHLSDLYSLCLIVIVSIGVIDDKYDVSVKLRMGVQSVIALVMMHYADSQITNLGNIFGFGDVVLNDIVGKIITVLAILGAINAFNMVDGIDGLLGGLSSVTFGALGIVFYMQSMPTFAYICAIFIVR